MTANDVLMGGGGAPTAKFKAHGDTYAGRIIAISEPYQEREYDPTNPGGGAPKFYPKSGDPIMTFNVDVATTLRDPSIEEDDGTRRIYMDGKRIKDAVRNAVRAVGAPGLAVGGTLSIAYVGDATPGDQRSGKNYQVTYTAPANNVLMGATPQQQAPAPAQPASQAQQVQQQQPVMQAAPAPAAQQAVDPGALAAFQAWQASQQQAQQPA